MGDWGLPASVARFPLKNVQSCLRVILVCFTSKKVNSHHSHKINERLSYLADDRKACVLSVLIIYDFFFCDK